MNLSSTQIKDTYGNLLTIGTVAGTPTTGTLQNGAGSDLTSITLNGGAVFNEGGGNFDFRVEGQGDANLLFVDASTARVGIGTNAPNGKLDVQGGTIEFDPGTGADSTRAFNFNIGGENYGKILVPSGSGGAMAFSTGGIGSVSERLRITSTGNVGIGTISPGSKLAISDNGTGLVFINAASGEFNLGLLAGVGSTDAYVYQRANAAMIFGTNNTERLRITGAGNVGIGETTPTSRLHVAAASGAVLKVFGADISNIAVVSGATKGVRIGADSTRGFIEGVDNTGIAQFHPLTLGGSDIRFATSGVSNEKMKITATEMVVNDLQLDYDFRVEGDTDSHLIFADAGNDRVGISTSTPQATLHVDGITCVNDNYWILSANASTAQSNTHTITISFTSQASQWSAYIVEVIYASSHNNTNAAYGGRATYSCATLTSITDVTELEDIGTDVSFAATTSGMDLIITATSTATAGQEPNRIGAVVRITRGNNAESNRPTGITLA